jgi:hypothetical protein
MDSVNQVYLARLHRMLCSVPWANPSGAYTTS